MMQQDLNEIFARAERAFQEGRLALAETLLGHVRTLLPNHPKPWHLTAIVAERADRPVDALAAFHRAADLAPGDAEILVDLADRLQDTEPDAALRTYDRALAIAPRLTAAYLGRGRLWHRLGRFVDSRQDLLRVYYLDPMLIDGWVARGEMELDAVVPAAAAIAFDRALELESNHPAALAGRARAALELGEKKAITLYEAASRQRPDDLVVAMGEAEAREASGEPEPYRRLFDLVARTPGWAEGQALLARMLWEGGAPDFDQMLRQAVADAPTDHALHYKLIALLAGIDRFSDAADAAREAAENTGDPQFSLSEARYAGSAGQNERAAAIFAALPKKLPGRTLDEARHLIRQGDIDHARRLVEQELVEQDTSVVAWALIDLIWRKTDDERAEWLHGQPGLISQYVLPFDEQSTAEMADYLRSLHHYRRHPAGQSMRGGTQTRGPLLSRQDPLAQALRGAISQAVMDHWRGLPALDVRHPLLRYRNLTPTLSGSWSVRLTGGGHHINHVHPNGLLSSASYWVVPNEPAQDGWLEIGRPPEDLGLDLPPIAAFEPRPGTLILFPSTLYHGTRPFTSGERITMAFDIAAS